MNARRGLGRPDATERSSVDRVGRGAWSLPFEDGREGVALLETLALDASVAVPALLCSQDEGASLASARIVQHW